MTFKEILLKEIHDKSARIGILGLGYVGLPLAVVFAEAGFRVIGVDPDQRRIDLTRSRSSGGACRVRFEQGARATVVPSSPVKAVPE